MKARMTHAARAELVHAVRNRYHAASGKAKRRILDEFIAASGYHEKSAIRVLNEVPADKEKQTRKRPSLYDEASRAALIVLWEASDRVCGKRLKALLPILLAAMERNGHLKLNAEIRPKVLSMSAATIDRLLRMPRSASRTRKVPRVVPEPRRRIKMRTFAEWHDPSPGSMEMDLVAHCGPVNRGSYVNSLVLTDIASGWTEAAPIVVREGSLVVETLERIRTGLPFALQALDVDNGILPQSWDRTYPFAPISQERPGVDRTEKRSRRAQVVGVPALRGSRSGKSNNSSLRSLPTVR
jgi:hypothetical protein